MIALVRVCPSGLEEWEKSLPTDMEWAKPEYSRNQVDRAGEAIIKPFPKWGDGEENWHAALNEYRAAVQVVNNWRSAHSYPLNCFQTNLRTRARKISEKPLVSQRLKRFESIVRKLVRPQTATLELSQMQDIGGCRAVLSNSAQVYTLAKSYQEQRTKKFAHQLVGVGKDYLAQPKPDGYRSIHLIFRWVGPVENNAWDKLRIEMQLRSVDQHAWATALETVDILTRQALKANQGDERWQRFFALMGSAIAFKEKCPTIPGTPENKKELKSELGDLAHDLNAIEVLHGFSTGIQAIHNHGASNNAGYYLLHLSFSQRKISWTPYGWNESQEANKRYTTLEQSVLNTPGEHVVLVKAGSISSIKRSYPSFFLDTGRFNQLLVDALGPEGLEPAAEVA